MYSEISARKSKGQKAAAPETKLRDRVMPSIPMSLARYDMLEKEADRLSSGIGGNSIDDVKAALGARMGIDFSSVKVHIGEDAKRSADRLGAAAYAKNGEVYLGDCGANPQVVAHELVHTAQQGVVKGGDTMSSPRRQCADV